MSTTGRRSMAVETPIRFSLTLETEPVGVRLAARLDEGLPRPAADALRKEVADTLFRESGNVIFQSIRVGHSVLEEYGQRHDYAVAPITESVALLDTSAAGRRVTARWGWQHDAASFFNFGVSPHTVDGDPLLSFIWEDAPAGVREMFSDTERVDGDPRVFFRSVDHPGIAESRFVQASMNWLRQELQR
jgi:hypothetical protein